MTYLRARYAHRVEDIGREEAHVAGAHLVRLVLDLYFGFALEEVLGLWLAGEYGGSSSARTM